MRKVLNAGGTLRTRSCSPACRRPRPTIVLRPAPLRAPAARWPSAGRPRCRGARLHTRRPAPPDNPMPPRPARQCGQHVELDRHGAHLGDASSISVASAPCCCTRQRFSLAIARDPPVRPACTSFLRSSMRITHRYSEAIATESSTEAQLSHTRSSSVGSFPNGRIAHQR
jgi:hypothetical protein